MSQLTVTHIIASVSFAAIMIIIIIIIDNKHNEKYDNKYKNKNKNKTQTQKQRLLVLRRAKQLHMPQRSPGGEGGGMSHVRACVQDKRCCNPSA